MWAIGVSGTVLLFVVASVGKTHDGVATELSFTAYCFYMLFYLLNTAGMNWVFFLAVPRGSRTPLSIALVTVAVPMAVIVTLQPSGCGSASESTCSQVPVYLEVVLTAMAYFWQAYYIQDADATAVPSRHIQHMYPQVDSIKHGIDEIDADSATATLRGRRTEAAVLNFIIELDECSEEAHRGSALSYFGRSMACLVCSAAFYAACENIQNYSELSERSAIEVTLIAACFTFLLWVFKSLTLEILGPGNIQPQVIGFHAEIVFVTYFYLIYYLFYRLLFNQVQTWFSLVLLACFRICTDSIWVVLRYTKWSYNFEWRVRSYLQQKFGFGVPKSATDRTIDQVRQMSQQRTVLYFGIQIVTDIVSSSIVFMCNLLLCEDQNGSSSGACIGPSQIQHVFLLPKGSGLWTLLIGIGIDATSGFLIFLFFYNVWLLDVRRIWWSCIFANRAHFICMMVVALHVATDATLLLFAHNTTFH